MANPVLGDTPVGLRHAGRDTGEEQRRRDVWRRVWWLVLSVLAPPLAGALVLGQHALAAALFPVLLHVPGTALILWLIGRFLGVDSGLVWLHAPEGRTIGAQ
jgi:hypothetical protein